jgi:hypothetical protein
MSTPTRGWLRGLRAASLGVVAFCLALVAHVAAGGNAPGPVALLLLAGLIALAAVLVTAGRLGPVRVGVSLAAMQVVLHEAFMWLGSPAGCPAPAGGRMSHGSQPMLECATEMAQAGVGPSAGIAASVMVGAHVAATAVMATLLAYAETVLWFLALRWLRLGLPELPVIRARARAVGAPRMSRVHCARGGVGRRGPPLPAW